ncbi:hypothetical protein AMTR_s00142p00068950 [Amborella trichopoda]|uniref:Uncharacterized protein n=1 Tax=Amborella trichopoda TaxID=13333 RepID=W1P835_AMBTC|nr:hypothetical protein AMTR_s00142p00068950 [Amborella trichopoda]
MKNRAQRAALTRDKLNGLGSSVDIGFMNIANSGERMNRAHRAQKWNSKMNGRLDKKGIDFQ